MGDQASGGGRGNWPQPGQQGKAGVEDDQAGGGEGEGGRGELVLIKQAASKELRASSPKLRGIASLN